MTTQLNRAAENKKNQFRQLRCGSANTGHMIEGLMQAVGWVSDRVCSRVNPRRAASFTRKYLIQNRIDDELGLRITGFLENAFDVRQA